MADRVVKQVRRPVTLPSLLQYAPQKRVAAYARVSTDSNEQMNSVEAQKDYFQKLILDHPDWELVDIYADEGISGTSITRREEFNRMISDAMDGKIDMILTKSLSRFARNTVDTLKTIRKLKSIGIGVYFEKEDIDTMDAKGEFLITLMSGLAEEESRSISENVKWGQRKRFADGKYSLPYKQFLGYKKGADGTPELVESEAKIVRTIYRLFLEGYSTSAIAKKLSDAGIPSPAGKPTWQRATVESILQNEKYYGAALLQKTFTVDFLQKKMKVNEGEVPQYYVEHSHEAIIAPDEWERVQVELARRKSNTRSTYCNSPFAGKIICGDCGEIYGSKIWHSNSKYRRTIWQCNAKYGEDKHCSTPHLCEHDLKQYFITALSELLMNREALLEDGKYILKELLDFAAMDSECDELAQEMDMVSDMIKKLVNGNATQAVSQTAYTERYNKLVEKYETVQSRYDALRQQKERRQIQANAISGCLFALSELDLLQITFSEALWNTTVDHVTVFADERLVFQFKNRVEIIVQK